MKKKKKPIISEANHGNAGLIFCPNCAKRLVRYDKEDGFDGRTGRPCILRYNVCPSPPVTAFGAIFHEIFSVFGGKGNGCGQCLVREYVDAPIDCGTVMG